jgi:hypothetical protein
VTLNLVTFLTPSTAIFSFSSGFFSADFLLLIPLRFLQTPFSPKRAENLFISLGPASCFSLIFQLAFAVPQPVASFRAISEAAVKIATFVPGARGISENLTCVHNYRETRALRLGNPAMTAFC